MHHHILCILDVVHLTGDQGAERVRQQGRDRTGAEVQGHGLVLERFPTRFDQLRAQAVGGIVPPLLAGRETLAGGGLVLADIGVASGIVGKPVHRVLRPQRGDHAAQLALRRVGIAATAALGIEILPVEPRAEIRQLHPTLGFVIGVLVQQLLHVFLEAVAVLAGQEADGDALRPLSAFLLEAVDGGPQRGRVFRLAEVHGIHRQAEVGQILNTGDGLVHHRVEPRRQNHGEIRQQRHSGVLDLAKAVFVVVDEVDFLPQGRQALAGARVLHLDRGQMERHDRNEAQDQDQHINRQADDERPRAGFRAAPALAVPHRDVEHDAGDGIEHRPGRHQQQKNRGMDLPPVQGQIAFENAADRHVSPSSQQLIRTLSDQQLNAH